MEGAAPTSTAVPSPVKLPQLNPRVLSTLNADGSRRWLRPIVSNGRYLSARRWVAYLLIGLFVAIPFTYINGKPAILLHLGRREFTLFGTTFFPTDTVILALILLSTFVGIFLITALYGRIWCGWACPQTVYMEFLFRPIERFFEGPPRRDGKPSLPPSGVRTVAKYVVFLIVSFLLANLFLSYFVGVEELAVWVRRSPLEHPGSFMVMAVTTALMLFDFVVFREQTCIVACPYGRLQSVLLDRRTLIISYDEARGEPRGKGKPGSDTLHAEGELQTAPAALSAVPTRQPARTVDERAELEIEGASHRSEAFTNASNARRGDCVDCGLCVVTCPTGIDIRNGLQLECVGCTQCIDACDVVMDKIGRPRGLIRYGSQAEMSGDAKRPLRVRVLIYYAILAVLLTTLTSVIVTRAPLDLVVLRGPGMPFVALPDGTVSNAVKIKITNRSQKTAAFSASVLDLPEARIVLDQPTLTIDPGQTRSEGATVIVPKSVFENGKREIRILITADTGLRADATYRLLGPATQSH